MFESLETRPTRKSVVQPVLALVVHAGLISLALRNDPEPATRRPPVPWTELVVFPTAQPEPARPSSPGGTGGVIPVSVPHMDMSADLPPLTPIMVTVPIHRPGTFDRRSYLAVGGAPDTLPPGVAVLTESDLTDPPRALHLAEPRYPDALRQAGIEGAVTVTYIVDVSGLVEPPSIRIVSSDHPAFGESVVAAVGKAQFTPGRVRGRAVRVLVRQIIRFATEP